MQLFHVQIIAAHSKNQVPFTEGAIVTAGESYNPYYDAIRISATRAGPDITSADIARSYRTMLREVVFEQIRIASFPKAPSRTSCLWVCRTLEEAQYWLSRIPHSGDKKIYELELKDGSIHEASEGHLSEASENIHELEVRARRYWNGAPAPTGGREALCAGKLTVVKRHV